MNSTPLQNEIVLPSTITPNMAEYLLLFLRQQGMSEAAKMRIIATLDLLKMIFKNDKNGHTRNVFLKKNFLGKLNYFLLISIYNKDNLSHLLSSSTLSVVYHLLATPGAEICLETIDCNLLQNLVAVVSQNIFEIPVRLAINCLCCLEWNTIQMRNSFLSLNGFHHLLEASMATTREVLIDIIKIFANFFSHMNFHSKKRLLHSGVLHRVLELCKMSQLTEFHFGGNVENLLKYCLIFLNNFLFKFDQGKILFCRLGGMRIISQLYFNMSGGDLCPIHFERVFKILLCKGFIQQNLPNFSTRYLEVKSSSGVIISLEEAHKQFTSSSSDLQNSETKGFPSCFNKRHYTHKMIVPFTSDKSHEILPLSVRLPKDTDKIGSIICGMLNQQSSGTIYLGIDQKSVVVGCFMNKKMKDNFRLVCHKIFSSMIEPSLSYLSIYDVLFVPVVNEREVIPNLFIIEISLKACEGFYAFQNSLYFRHDEKTIELELTMLQSIIISDRSRQLEKEQKLLLANICR